MGETLCVAESQYMVVNGDHEGIVAPQKQRWSKYGISNVDVGGKQVRWRGRGRGIGRWGRRGKEKEEGERKRRWRVEKNKVIRPKSRASALSKKVRQTDRQTIFFQKDIWNGLLFHKVPFLPFMDMKNAEKPFCDRPTNQPTDRPTDGPTDRRTDGPTDRRTEKWLIESRSTRLKMNGQPLFQ